ncbi:hypothetical protein MHC_03645 [Mycoplasma haemocanis str. Illinois]|uniref:Uncharacterized protein n=1 Tax=Mycoplasma haemocanis (strain Illinois) TaxID=1111676 RepID=H6N7G7_MYCHN|nr:hypothetical protein [Mycoplasma haemocanis]AEW45589.1 hypothetical protein MHC_03645 [Mycoplasma haemocanis str. Illinois]
MNYKILVIAAGGTTAAAGGGVFLTRSLSSNRRPDTPKVTIRSRLQEVGYSLDVNDSEWNAIFQEHNKGTYAANTKFSATDVQSLKTKCLEYLNEEDSDSKYELSKKWCVKPTKISEFLKALGLTSLKTEDGDSNTDKVKWEKLVGEYGKNGKEKIPGFELKNPSGNDTWKELKDKCKEMLEFQPWNSGYEMAMKSTKVWCSSNS